MGSLLRKAVQNLGFAVIDEIHQLASDRRGAQLSIALERLEDLIGEKSFQRIGLSATISNKDEVARFLVGADRKVTIVDASKTAKAVEYRIEMPEPAEEDYAKASELYATPHAVAKMQRIADLVKGHESTLIFVNSRTTAEFLAARLSSFQVKAGVHHGSLPREERERVEIAFKDKSISALVCTSTLELGIDIGSVDLVIQYMSSRQVNSLIQRVGRSGHSLSKTSEGVTIAASPEDALESIVISKRAKEGKLEPVAVQECALDVLCHQIAGILLEKKELAIQDILNLCKRSYCYRALSKDQLQSVTTYMQTLGYLTINQDKILARSWKCRKYYLENLSMIPDERRYGVIDASTSQKVGILGEEFMIIHAKVGVNFIIKGRVWKIESIQGDSVYVTPVVDPSASVPGWDGELLPIPEAIALSTASERSFIESKLTLDEQTLLEQTKFWNADRNARAGIIQELHSQKEAGAIPTENRIVIEKFDRYLIIHTSRGERINVTLGELFEEILLRKGLVRRWWNDGYRIMIELTTEEFDPKEIAGELFDFNSQRRGFLNAVIRKHFPFGYYMKFIAERFGALQRGMMLSEEALKELVVKFRFTPIYDETLREALLQKIDIEGALALLESCKDSKTVLEVIALENSISPLGQYIFRRYAEMESFESEARNTTELMRNALEKEVVSLLCFQCANLSEFVQVKKLEEQPKCPACNSSLIGVVFYGAHFAQSALEKKRKGVALSEEESQILMKARRSADLVLSYGKKGVIAQCAYGIGPQTAAKVLSRMQITDEEFYSDLLQAKLNFIRTRQYWD